MPEHDPDVRDTLLRGLTQLRIATVILYIAVIGVGGYVYLQADKSRDALCNLRDDVQARAQASRKFLEEHPEGVPGIPVGVIKQGIDNSQRTVDALEPLNCPSPPPDN